MRCIIKLSFAISLHRCIYREKHPYFFSFVVYSWNRVKDVFDEQLTYTAHIWACPGYVGILGTKFRWKKRSTVGFVPWRTCDSIARRARVRLLARAFTCSGIKASLTAAIGIIARAKPVFTGSPGTRGAGSAVRKGCSYVVAGKVVADQK